MATTQWELYRKSSLFEVYKAYADFYSEICVPIIDFPAVLYLSRVYENDFLLGMIVGPPSSGKKMLIKPYAELDDGLLMSAATAKSLQSGYAGAKDHLRDFQGKCVVTPEMSPFLRNYDNSLEDFYSTIRAISDGAYRKLYGGPKAETEENDIHFSWLIGVTSDWTRYQAFRSQLGDRFLKVNMPELNEWESATKALEIETSGRHTHLENRICDSIERAIERIEEQRSNLPKIPRDVGKIIKEEAILTGLLRTNVNRNRYGALESDPSPESPGRLTKQFARIAQLEAEIWGKPEVDCQEIALLNIVRWSSCPKTRAEVFQAAMIYPRGYVFKVKEIMEHVGFSYPTVKRELEDMADIGIMIDKTEEGSKYSAPRYQLNGDLFDRLRVLDAMPRGMKICWPLKT